MRKLLPWSVAEHAAHAAHGQLATWQAPSQVVATTVATVQQQQQQVQLAFNFQVKLRMRRK